jgi:hypothetical protein
MWITVSKPPFDSVEEFDRVHAALGEEPEGLQARYVGMADGAPRIVAVWESREHADRFLSDRLGPALTKALGPEPTGAPEYLAIDVSRSYTREPVAS